MEVMKKISKFYTDDQSRRHMPLFTSHGPLFTCQSTEEGLCSEEGEPIYCIQPPHSSMMMMMSDGIVAQNVP